jgi:glycosyltransferase involved in cell wall biosynthesis
VADIPAASKPTSVTELRADRPPLKIAQVAPLIESVPPKLYGGTERVVAYLTEELVRMGHDVTLFASGDSTTSAKLVPCSERALRLDPRVADPIPHYMVMLSRLHRRMDEFDIIHFHIDSLQYPLFRDFAFATRYAPLPQKLETKWDPQDRPEFQPERQEQADAQDQNQHRHAPDDAV